MVVSTEPSSMPKLFLTMSFFSEPYLKYTSDGSVTFLSNFLSLLSHVLHDLGL